MSQGIIIALITAIGSIVGAVISSLILRTKEKETSPLWGTIIGGAVLGAVALLFVLWVLGMFPPVDNPPKLTLADYGELLYQDTFEGATGGWSLPKNVSVKDGKLIIGAGGTSFPSSATTYDNFIAEITFQYPESNSSTAYFNTYFRETLCNNKLCGYQISIASDGTYGVTRYIDPEFVKILPATITYQLTPNQPNTLDIVAKGSIIKIYLNKSFIGEFTDSVYINGKFHFDADFGIVEVDEFKIYALP